MNEIRIGFSQYFSLSKNQLGYNFKLFNTKEFVYFHNVKKVVFKQGDKFLLTFKPSSRVAGRLDAESVEVVKDLCGAIQFCWSDKTKRNLLFDALRDDEQTILHYEKQYLSEMVQAAFSDEEGSAEIVVRILDEAGEYELRWPFTFYLLQQGELTNLNSQLICSVLQNLSEFYISKLVLGWGCKKIFPNLEKLNVMDAWAPCLDEMVTSWLDAPKSAPAELGEMTISVFDRVINLITFPDNFAAVAELYLLLSEPCRKRLANVIPIEFIPCCFDEVSEIRLVEYICSFYTNFTPESFNEISNVVIKRDFFEAQFLLNMIEAWRKGQTFSAFSLVQKVQELQELMFSHHAVQRSRINPVIFSYCFLAINRSDNRSATRSRLFTICEGKLISSQQPGYLSEQTHQSDTSYTLCRRNRCDEVPYNKSGIKQKGCKSHSDFPFYKLAFELFGITAQELHANNDYVKFLSAFNRWNTILDRLFCSCCEEPLSVSEHSPGSLGHMAVGATYWHCVNNNCAQFCASIKIVYCIGCQKVIDSRQDTQACNPFEIRSYKKFYICQDCGSCCNGHNGFSGRCPNCGTPKAFAIGVPNTMAACNNCGHRISVPKTKWDKYERQFAENLTSSNSDSYGCSFMYLGAPDAQGMDSNICLNIPLPWQGQILYVYDIFACMTKGKLSVNSINSYTKVYDVSLIERIVFLGQDHPKYKGQNTPKAQLKSILDSAKTENVQQNLEQYLVFLFEQMDDELWNHYNSVELPFLFALNNLLAEGIKLDKALISSRFPDLETKRNKLINDLLTMGVGNPDIGAANGYLLNKYPIEDTNDLLKVYQRLGPKPLINNDPIFEILHSIEKVERGAQILTNLAKLPNNVIPEYQIMGAVTGRCTAKNPNLLSLPKEYRYVIAAESGMAIVECDYKQMEIGILAALANDEKLIWEFNNTDVYQQFADEHSLSRDAAKNIFISMLYGMSASTLGKMLVKDEQYAWGLIDKFYQKYPDIRVYQQELIRFGAKQGFVSTVTGLKRKLDVIKDVEHLSNWEKNWLKNFPVQANAAVVFKSAIVELAKNLVGNNFKLLVPHYDAIVFQASINELDAYTVQVESAMIRAMRKYFPALKPKISINRDTPGSWS